MFDASEQKFVKVLRAFSKKAFVNSDLASAKSFSIEFKNANFATIFLNCVKQLLHGTTYLSVSGRRSSCNLRASQQRLSLWIWKQQMYRS